jgi:NADPH2:quinone reductase
VKAIRVDQLGGPDVLRMQELPDPEPGPGEALVRVEAAGVNFIDVYFRTGLYPMEPPFTPGQEGAGVVEAVGPDVADVKAGDAVGWVGVPGTYAELAVVPAAQLVPLPDGVTTRQAAAALLQGMTAHYLVTDTYRLMEGDACLVHAAAGGVGLLLVQLAKARGARVFATTSTPEKAALAAEAGADAVIRYTERDFVDEVKRLTDGAGIQVAYDSVGGTTWEGSLACLAPRGMLVLFGQSSGPVPPIDPLRLSRGGSLFLTRPVLFHYIDTREDLLARAGEVLGAVRDDRLKLRIGLDVPLAEARYAHESLEGRKTTGKILLRP